MKLLEAVVRHVRSLALLLVLASAASAVPPRDVANQGWGEFIDPDRDCQLTLDAGKLAILVPGVDHDLSIERGIMNAPRAMQAVEGDFRIQVKVSGLFAPADRNNPSRGAYQGAGLLILKDDRTYLRLDRATYWDGKANRVYGNFEVRKNGKLERLGMFADLRLEAGKDTWLKIERKANTFSAHATQEAGKWQTLGEKSVEMPAQLRAGVTAINTSRQVFGPKFSELKVETGKEASKRLGEPSDR